RVLRRPPHQQVHRKRRQRRWRRTRRVPALSRERRPEDTDTVTVVGMEPPVERSRNVQKRKLSGRALAVLAIAAFTAAIAVVSAQAGGTQDKTFYFIPKDTLNPYEVIADRGGKLALTELGQKQVVSSGTQDTAAAQQPSIQAAIQSGAAGIVIAAN